MEMKYEEEEDKDWEEEAFVEHVSSVGTKEIEPEHPQNQGRMNRRPKDSGSTSNLIYEEMVSKLKLQIRRYPNHCWIAWLQKDHKALVNEQCLVKFKIGNYHDELLCYIMSMDVCHMLLRIPWQFDRHAVHDGYTNIYSLTKDGVQHKLKTLKEKEEKVCSNARICLVDGRKFIDGMKREHLCFSFIPKINKVEVEDIPLEVADLFDEFQDIVFDNLPNVLPSMRNIIHQMDLNTGTSLLNKETHRVTPTKSEKLNIQVQELL
ncbi:uncharacterized protein LOC131856798 [Cryptomeria japonica]|uniref:uncharacterized protein LOC131856798 n=1 Tax=Cryptomeria japonica TaxID=3369 RepID=UPI0027DA5BB5|nr:uncharacterized protein LOC131856798 [Cryptomeria japonica]